MVHASVVIEMKEMPSLPFKDTNEMELVADRFLAAVCAIYKDGMQGMLFDKIELVEILNG